MKHNFKNKPLFLASISKVLIWVMVLTLSYQNLSASPFPGENDRIGWSSDGNLADEDDWAATALALAIFAKMEWQDKLVHFDYNNRLDRSHEWKEIENHESTIGGARRFGFNEEVFFDDQRELEAAIEHAKEEINKSHEGSKFWYVQAGPFEVAYQALFRADPDKRQYCILVSHSEVNEVSGKWELEDGSPAHGRDECLALGATYFFTTNQYMEKFGGKRFKKWEQVEWMKNSPNENYRWLHSRFLATAKHKDGGLDASDGGMAFVLATGDLDGNFSPKLKNFLLNESLSEEWIPLFNGTSLEGWHVSCVDEDKGKNFWRVAEGTMECNSMGNSDHDYYWLCTDEEYADFEMKLKFRVFRDNKGNSGVQVRSRYDRRSDAPNGGWLDGPQVDIHPKDPWRNGLVYDETRGSRGWIYPFRPESGINSDLVAHEVVFKYSDEGDGWNDMKITCKGTGIKTVVNGITVCDKDFDGILNDAAHKKYDVGLKGHIALQMHRKAELNIQFKDLYIKNIVAHQ